MNSFFFKIVHYVDKTESFSTCRIFSKLLFCRQFCWQSACRLTALLICICIPEICYMADACIVFYSYPQGLPKHGPNVQHTLTSIMLAIFLATVSCALSSDRCAAPTCRAAPRGRWRCPRCRTVQHTDITLAIFPAIVNCASSWDRCAAPTCRAAPRWRWRCPRCRTAAPGRRWSWRPPGGCGRGWWSRTSLGRSSRSGRRPCRRRGSCHGHVWPENMNEIFWTSLLPLSDVFCSWVLGTATIVLTFI